MKQISSRLTYANVMATIAVFLALGGVGYAATQLPKNSVGSAQVKQGAIKLGDLSKSARKELKGNQGPQGPKGAPGVPAQTATGPYRLTVPAAQVVPETFLTASYGQQLTRITAPSSTGASGALLQPAFPPAPGSSRIRVLSVRVCTDASASSITLAAVQIEQFRSSLAAGDEVASHVEGSPPQGDSCRPIALPSPFVLGPDDYLNVEFRIEWNGAGSLQVGTTTIEYDYVT